MNIFILDNNPALAAQAHADIHVNKMILESAQMLCTVYGGPYRPTHKNHPCTLWVAKSEANAAWLKELAYYLNEEAKLRYGKSTDHKSWEVIAALPIKDRGVITPFAQAMPEELRSADAVQSYRAYYRTKPKIHWEYTEPPEWW